MIGLIVTGHGNFGTGLTSAINLIAGPQENYVAIDFTDDAVDKLEADINAAFDQLSNCDGIIVFCDLPGGSPFKTAVMQSQGRNNIEVIAGTNMPMLAEITMARSMIDELDVLVETALNIGKEQIVKFAMSKPQVNEPDGDGI